MCECSLEFLGSLVEFARAFVFLRWQILASDAFDGGSIVSIEEDDNGVQLVVVELFNRIWSDI